MSHFTIGPCLEIFTTWKEEEEEYRLAFRLYHFTLCTFDLNLSQKPMEFLF